MTTRLLTGEGRIWPEITAAAKKASRADVAVAYFGDGGAKLLPLKKGSRLVVDASEGRVKTGATNPAELLKLQDKGVAIYSVPNLHAKVFAFPRKAFIGSTNVSSRSKGTLAEAVVETTEAGLVSDARLFVRELTGAGRLGPEELDALKNVYKPPKAPVGRRAPSGPRDRKPAVWVSGYQLRDWPEGYEDVAEEEQAAVEAEWDGDRKTHYLEEQWERRKPPWRLGDTVVWISDEENGAPVHPPARVMAIRSLRLAGAVYWFTHTEHPYGNRCGYSRMCKSLGRGWKKRLQKDGRLSAANAAELIRWWDRRGVGT